jgi:hypothetical protein
MDFRRRRRRPMDPTRRSNRAEHERAESKQALALLAKILRASLRNADPRSRCAIRRDSDEIEHEFAFRQEFVILA